MCPGQLQHGQWHPYKSVHRLDARCCLRCSQLQSRLRRESVDTPHLDTRSSHHQRSGCGGWDSAEILVAGSYLTTLHDRSLLRLDHAGVSGCRSLLHGVKSDGEQWLVKHHLSSEMGTLLTPRATYEHF